MEEGHQPIYLHINIPKLNDWKEHRPQSKEKKEVITSSSDLGSFKKAL
jgi:hypothetical protein